jgi:16S rRNA (guanine527-N7)-methyltransferase
MDRLGRYEAMLKKWNPKINLVSDSTISDVWHRHFADSAQLFSYIPSAASSWLDFGSGAGFPGLVCAAMAASLRPKLHFTLAESDQRKSSFLLNTIRELDLNASVVVDRIENIPPQRADIISARAVSALDQLLEYSMPHAHESTVLLFPKGNSYETELTAARNHWHIEEKVFRSLTDPKSVILRIEGFERAK